MKPDSLKPLMDEEEQAQILLWLRATIVVCLFLAALSVLDAFISLFAYWAFLGGRMDPNQYPEWHKGFQEIQQAPLLFIGMNLYNVMLWNGVIVSCIWLLRYYVWSRALLKTLLGLDMIVTVFHLLWKNWQNQLAINNPGWFIMINAMQVGAIIALTHPRIVQYLEGISLQQKQAVHSIHNPDQ